MDDLELLHEYARNQSEAAFRQIVQRHLALVYSAALRQVGDPGLAEDISQFVFILLARKAGQLPGTVVISGWLYRTTRYAAAKALRTEYRRRRREQEAFPMITEDSGAGWKELAPFLDEAMAHLGQVDRDAVLLRYFQNRSLREVGRALGTNEDAAQKRVARALERLRGLLLKRGVAISGVAISGLLATHAAQIAPMELSATVTAAALSQTAVSAPVAAWLHEALRQSIWPKVTTALSGALALTAIVGVAVYFWPKSKPESSAVSFAPGIVRHPRPTPQIAARPAIVPIPVVPQPRLPSAPAPLPQPAPPRVAQLPTRGVSAPAPATNFPALALSRPESVPLPPSLAPEAGQTLLPAMAAPVYRAASPPISVSGAGLRLDYKRGPLVFTNRAAWMPVQRVGGPALAPGVVVRSGGAPATTKR